MVLLTCWGTRKCRHTYHSTSRIRYDTAGLTLWRTRVQTHSLSVLEWCTEALSGLLQRSGQISHCHQPISSIMLGLCRALMTDKMLIQDADMEAMMGTRTTFIKIPASTTPNRIREEVSGDRHRITYVASVLRATLLASKEQTHPPQTTYLLRIAQQTIPSLVRTYLIRTIKIRGLVMPGKHTCWNTCHQGASVFLLLSHQPRYQPQTPTVSSLIKISHLVIMNKATVWTSSRIWSSEISCLRRRRRRTMSVNHSKLCSIRAPTKRIKAKSSLIESSLLEWAKM